MDLKKRIYLAQVAAVVPAMIRWLLGEVANVSDFELLTAAAVTNPELASYLRSERITLYPMAGDSLDQRN